MSYETELANLEDHIAVLSEALKAHRRTCKLRRKPKIDCACKPYRDSLTSLMKRRTELLEDIDLDPYAQIERENIAALGPIVKG